MVIATTKSSFETVSQILDLGLSKSKSCSMISHEALGTSDSAFVVPQSQHTLTKFALPNTRLNESKLCCTFDVLVRKDSPQIVHNIIRSPGLRIFSRLVFIAGILRGGDHFARRWMPGIGRQILRGNCSSYVVVSGFILVPKSRITK